MFIASVINAKVHLFSGLVIGALIVAATRRMKRNCWRCEKKCNFNQPTSSHKEDLTV